MTMHAGYAKYIESPEWKNARAAYLRERERRGLKNQCWICGNKNGLQVHHVTYERFRNERFDDFRLLCSSCHKLVHDWRDANPGISILDATNAVRHEFAQQRHRKQVKRKLKKQLRAKDRDPRWLADRLGLEPGETKVRYRQSS